MILYFGTTSDVKFNQYQVIFRDLGITLDRTSAVSRLLVEPQIVDQSDRSEELLVSHPLRQIARFVERMRITPYMIEDTMLLVKRFSISFPSTSGLPGADTKSWWRNLGVEGVLEMMRGSEDRSARFICQIGIYVGKGKYLFERAYLDGSISLSERVSIEAENGVPRSNPYYFHRIFVPNGCAKTIAELDAKDFTFFDYRRVCAQLVAKKLTNIDEVEQSQFVLEL